MSKSKFSTHELLSNSISLIALILSIITAYFQFKPQNESIQIVSQQKILTGYAIKIGIGGLPLPNNSVSTNEIGPITWKIVVFNPTERPLSLTDLSVRYAHPQGDIQQSGMLLNIASGTDRIAIDFPIQIAAREAKSIFISLKIPVKLPSDKNILRCKENLSSIENFESCIYNFGFDIFGNSVKRLVPKQFGGIVQWDKWPDAPIFRATIRTAGNASAATILTYYPQSFS
jgi:hypothetical protein